MPMNIEDLPPGYVVEHTEAGLWGVVKPRVLEGQVVGHYDKRLATAWLSACAELIKLLNKANHNGE
jgi:hypothetical protein